MASQIYNNIEDTRIMENTVTVQPTALKLITTADLNSKKIYGISPTDGTRSVDPIPMATR